MKSEHGKVGMMKSIKCTNFIAPAVWIAKKSFVLVYSVSVYKYIKTHQQFVLHFIRFYRAFLLVFVNFLGTMHVPIDLVLFETGAKGTDITKASVFFILLLFTHFLFEHQKNASNNQKGAQSSTTTIIGTALFSYHRACAKYQFHLFYCR